MGKLSEKVKDIFALAYIGAMGIGSAAFLALGIYLTFINPIYEATFGEFGKEYRERVNECVENPNLENMSKKWREYACKKRIFEGMQENPDYVKKCVESKKTHTLLTKEYSECSINLLERIVDNPDFFKEIDSKKIPQK